jgi:RimJ/RimL family protein N-acetyltransferase
MVPLDLRDSYTFWLVDIYASSLKRGIGWLTVRHALLARLPGFWGDRERSPYSVIYVREGDGKAEAFGLLNPHPAVGWLLAQGRPFTLLAPDEEWEDEVALEIDPIDRGEIVSWLPGFYRRTVTEKTANVRRLTHDDAAVFQSSAPPWALRCWPSFDSIIGRGAVFGVPFGDTFASLAWVIDRTESYDAIGVYTAPRFRNLGLARAAASALVEHIIHQRRKVPLWAASAANQASTALARSVGFTPRVTEVVYHWPPFAPAIRESAETTQMGSR